MNVRHIIEKSLQMIVVAALFTSCDMMKEDRDDCPTGLYVNFVYDYNIQRADMFKDHVGSVTLYVFDESDKLVAQRTVNGASSPCMDIISISRKTSWLPGTSTVSLPSLCRKTGMPPSARMVPNIDILL